MQPIKKGLVLSFAEGFTLIELIITIGIILIISTVSIAGYKSFNTRQTLIQEGRGVRTFLRQAQNDAQTGTQPNPGCSQYGNTWAMDRVRVEINSGQLIGSIICIDSKDPSQTKPPLYYNRSLQPTSSFQFSMNSPGWIDFFTLSRGSTAGYVCVSKDQLIYKISVSQGGEIKDEGVVANCP